MIIAPDRERHRSSPPARRAAWSFGVLTLGAAVALQGAAVERVEQHQDQAHRCLSLNVRGEPGGPELSSIADERIRHGEPVETVEIPVGGPEFAHTVMEA